jgi:hypothetical protein
MLAQRTAKSIQEVVFLSKSYLSSLNLSLTSRILCFPASGYRGKFHSDYSHASRSFWTALALGDSANLSQHEKMASIEHGEWNATN